MAALRLELAVELATIVAQEQSQGALLPPSVRALILARLAPLSQAARHLVQVSAVLGTAANAQLLWQLAEMEVQAGDRGPGGGGQEWDPARGGNRSEADQAAIASLMT